MHDLQRTKKLRIRFLTFRRALLLFTLLLGSSFGLVTHFAFAQSPASPSAKTEPTKHSQPARHSKNHKSYKSSKSHKGNTTHKRKTVKKSVIVPPNGSSLSNCNNLSYHFCSNQQNNNGQYIINGQSGSNLYSQGQSSNQAGSGLYSQGQSGNQAGSSPYNQGGAGYGRPVVPFPGLPSTGCDPSPHASPDPSLSC
jgi:hypothetical protein